MGPAVAWSLSQSGSSGNFQYNVLRGARITIVTWARLKNLRHHVGDNGSKNGKMIPSWDSSPVCSRTVALFDTKRLFRTCCWVVTGRKPPELGKMRQYLTTCPRTLVVQEAAILETVLPKVGFYKRKKWVGWILTSHFLWLPICLYR